MAVYQFRAWIVPTLAISERGGLLPLLRDSSSELWDDIEPGWVAIAETMLGLSPSKSWRFSTRLWGAQDQDYVSETTENGTVVEVECGIDAGTFDAARSRLLADFLATLGASLIDAETGTLVRADADELLRTIRESRAGRYVADPAAYLADLARRKQHEADEDD